MQMGRSRHWLVPRSHVGRKRLAARMAAPLPMVLLALLGAALPGCESKPAQNVRSFFKSTGESDLKAGIRNFESNRLTQAAENFNDALRNGLTGPDEVTANKYLAFIAFAQKRERQCRAYFLRALELDPQFNLTPTEASNPEWGPLFRRLKDRR
jgi:hypothetical protein